MGRYNFVSPGAASGNAIEAFLMQRALEERQRILDEQTRQQQARVDEDRKREIGLRERQFNADQERQARMDAAAEDERQRGIRQETNAAGVRGMMADAMMQGPLTPESAKTIGVMAFREGVDAPPEVAEMLKPDTSGRELANYEAKKMIDASMEKPDAPDAGSWASAGNGMLYNTKTGATKPIGGGGSGSGGNASDDYAADTADRTIAAIDEVLPKINNWTAGAGGSILSKFPGTEAANVNAELQTVAGNIAFNALQQMRNASKTGGALGSVAQQELQLLQSVEGSLRQDQSPANLRAQLGKVRESMARFKAAQAMGGGLQMKRSGGDGGGGVVKWGRDANGRPVRVQ